MHLHRNKCSDQKDDNVFFINRSDVISPSISLFWGYWFIFSLDSMDYTRARGENKIWRTSFHICIMGKHIDHFTVASYERLKSLTTGLFVQLIVRAHNKKNTKVSHHWPIVKGFHRWPVYFAHKVFPCHDVSKGHYITFRDGRVCNLRKRWRATACCGKSKFAISSGWLKKGSVSHPDDIITLP